MRFEFLSFIIVMPERVLETFSSVIGGRRRAEWQKWSSWFRHERKRATREKGIFPSDLGQVRSLCP